MDKVERDEEREDRILFDVIVDAHDSEEQAMGWFYYVGGNCTFPFKARCTSERSVSPLRVDEIVEITDIASGEDCEREIFVLINLNDRTLGVPLSQLTTVATDNETETIVADWNYWVARGYSWN